MQCKFCGNEHGIIGETVCPVNNKMPWLDQYKPKNYYLERGFPKLEVTWPVEKYDFKNTPEGSTMFTPEKKYEFYKFMKTIGGRPYRIID